MSAIVANELTKIFRVHAPAERRRFGMLSGTKAKIDVAAIQRVSFAIERGERVAFIGPNGAGKSTTLRILTGILWPTSGQAVVAGHIPWTERRQLARRIGIVFGQRSQLWYHLPVRDTYDFLARAYGLQHRRYVSRLNSLAKMFAVGDLLLRPVGQLSLGQRLRCEIVASLLHEPNILLLDEPTIGLDVVAKATLRHHLSTIARNDGTTILLTSHDVGDIEQVCERAIIIDNGGVLLDWPLTRLRNDVLRHRVVVLKTGEDQPHIDLPGVTVSDRKPHRITLTVNTETTSIETVVSHAIACLSVRDLAVETPPMEEVIRAVYRGNRISKRNAEAQTMNGDVFNHHHNADGGGFRS